MKTYNLGTGQGVSVLELLHGVEEACGMFQISVPFFPFFFLIKTKTNKKQKTKNKKQKQTTKTYIGKKLPYKFAERRAGDLASNYADASLAEKELGWKAKRRLSFIIYYLLFIIYFYYLFFIFYLFFRNG